MLISSVAKCTIFCLFAYLLRIFVSKITVSATDEKRVHGLLRQMRHFLTDMSNRVEHQKRNQTATEVVAVWFRFWCSTRPSAHTGTD